jgi:HD-GYP domain-containing protein (c-di-GMP phosphodiesterase class II)
MRESRPTRYDERPDLAAAQLEIFARELSELLVQTNEQHRLLRDRYKGFARTLAIMVEGYDETTGTHLDRTQRWATAVARTLQVPHLDELQLGFLLHDIGKHSIPLAILQKPGPLDELEWRIMRTHPAAGAQLVLDVVPPKAIDVIRCHHERWDGRGYPRGLAGDTIPIGARIFSVIDVFDALITDRPYRGALPVQDALSIIRKDRERAFDPGVVDVFLDFIQEHVEELAR